MYRFKKIVYFKIGCFLFLPANSVFAFLPTNFTGVWQGTCVTQGHVQDLKMVIQQTCDDSILIDGKTIGLKQPTVFEEVGSNNGQPYHETMVYDYHWDSLHQYIETSRKWLGYYLQTSGSWIGESNGTLKLSYGRLITYEKSQNVERDCQLQKVGVPAVKKLSGDAGSDLEQSSLVGK